MPQRKQTGRRRVRLKPATIVGNRITINSDELPPAEIVGFATSVGVLELDYHFHLDFYDRNLAVVANCVLGMDDFPGIWTSAERFYRELADWMRQRRIPVTPVSGILGPRPTYPPWICNVITVSRNALDSQLETYYVTARSVARARQGKGDLDVIPIFAVLLSTPVLAGLLAFFDSRISDVNARVEKILSPQE